MGIVPLQYKAGDTAESLGLTGKEKFDIHLPATLVPGQDIAVNTEKRSAVIEFCEPSGAETFTKQHNRKMMDLAILNVTRIC